MVHNKTRLENALIFIFTLSMLEIVSSGVSREIRVPIHPEGRLELKRLEECYHILDQTAERIWPGWTNYKSFPFLFEFENGLRLLIGHPQPPSTFIRVKGLSVGGNEVWADGRNVRPSASTQPLEAGGGIISYGYFKGRSVSVVHMTFKRKFYRIKQFRGEFKSEQRILAFIHELFHGHQIEGLKIQARNLRFNPDIHFALYSEIEGRALLRAFQAAEREDLLDGIKDFLLAREIKRRSMPAIIKRHESADDLREGTAVFTEMRALEILKQGFEPHLTKQEDPAYGGFNDFNTFMADYVERLQKSSREAYDSRIKCYAYGCFQALLLQRLDPDWQKPFRDEFLLLDEQLRQYVSLSEEDKIDREKKWPERYNTQEIRERTGKSIEDRDAAYKDFMDLEGRVYIISFKPIKEYVESYVESGMKFYPLGFLSIYPGGVGTLQMDDLKITPYDKQAVIDQLYYLKFVDTEMTAGRKDLDLRFESQDGEEIYRDVVLTTPVFKLEAPKIRIRETSNRVKIWILSSFREANDQ